jgi:lipopolysaccharide/colanic/teichoic acid biosynthesis glycosyltransferase
MNVGERRRGWLSGYRRAPEFLYRAFTIILALVLIILCLPLFVVIFAVTLVRDGWPVFYAGPRLGKDKKLFTMYKFRTLVPEANHLIGANLFSQSLSSNRKLLNPTGHFLRETRLDEIPQLLNILKGDMDLLGPRPVRPEFYEKFCREIPDFDRRFEVRPGLLGYAQLFTPHSSPARLRAIIDLRFLQRKHRYFSEIFLVMGSFFFIGVRLLSRVFAIVTRKMVRVLGGIREQRELERVVPRDVLVNVREQNAGPGAASAGLEAVIVDANEEAFSLRSAEPIPEGPLMMELKVPVYRRGVVQPKVKTARCTGRVFYARKEGGKDGRYGTVVLFTPLSPLNYYLVHQYLMESSIVQP